MHRPFVLGLTSIIFWGLTLQVPQWVPGLQGFLISIALKCVGHTRNNLDQHRKWEASRQPQYALDLSDHVDMKPDNMSVVHAFVIQAIC